MDVVIGILGFSGIVVIALLFTGKFGGFKFGLGKDGVKAEVEAVKPATVHAVPSNTQSVQIGLDEAAIKKLFENQERNLEAQIKDQTQKLLSSGTQEDQEEVNTLNKQLAGVQAKLADTQKALEDRKSVLSETEKALENEKLKSVIPEEELAEAKQKLEEGDASSVERLFANFIEKRQSQDEPWAEVAHSLGKLARDRIDYGAALNYFELAVQLAPDNTLYLNEAGLMLAKLGQYDKPIEYYEKALASGLKTFGPDHPNVAITWNNLGGVWKYKGEDEKAIEFFEKALASDLKTFGPDHPDVAIRWNNLGGAWGSKGNYDKAIEYFEKALASDLKTFGPDHPDVAIRWNNLGGAWGSKGNYDKAIEYFEKALQVFEKTGLEHKGQVVKDNIAGLEKSDGTQAE